jgi:FkbM family methyltransferase
MRENIKPGMTVLDVGANIGFYSVLLSELVGENGKVYAFEPDTTNFSFLQKNTAHLKNVVIEKVAVAETDGVIKLYKSESLNVDHQTYDVGESRAFTEIPCISLDSYMKGAPVNFIKIDVQGFDYYAIKGASKILAANKELSIISEVWPFGLNKASATPQQYISLLKDNGFTVEVDEKAFAPEAISTKDYYTDFIATKHV